MEHFQLIYTSRAAEYQAMIAAEDADGQLLDALQALPLPARPGKNLGWTDWTHGPGAPPASGTPPPVTPPSGSPPATPPAAPSVVWPVAP